MNNKSGIECSYRIIWRIMEISEGVIRLGKHPPRCSNERKFPFYDEHNIFRR